MVIDENYDFLTSMTNVVVGVVSTTLLHVVVARTSFHDPNSYSNISKSRDVLDSLEKGEEQFNPRLPRKEEELKNVEKNSTEIQITSNHPGTPSVKTGQTQKPSFLIAHYTRYPVTEGELMHNLPLEKTPAHKKLKADNSWSPTLEAVRSESSASLNFVDFLIELLDSYFGYIKQELSRVKVFLRQALNCIDFEVSFTSFGHEVFGFLVVLATLAFDLNINHPYKPLVEAIKKFKAAQNVLAQVAWNFVNDGFLCEYVVK
ncbi:Cyclin-T1-5 [Prunus dulcis]|uniref:Cyclin-T1-5 n=1 Tax=Prunus dulcis TaxID=3755 RepID=A0A4Y1RT32_PRUDU|nr:Cyclin-T1-5 [Prunus dulcis]